MMPSTITTTTATPSPRHRVARATLANASCTSASRPVVKAHALLLLFSFKTHNGFNEHLQANGLLAVAFCPPICFIYSFVYLFPSETAPTVAVPSPLQTAETEPLIV